MGRSLIIVLLGFAVSFGILAHGKNRRMVESVDRYVDRYADYTTKNISNSGIYLALNQLYLNPAWNAGYNNVMIGDDSLAVDVSSSAGNIINVVSRAANAYSSDSSKATLFDGRFSDFAVWTKDSTVTNVTAKDSTDNVNNALIKKNAPFMPDIDSDSLGALATAQSHYHNSDYMAVGVYPVADFEYAGSTPNVTVVQGDLTVLSTGVLYGIFLVEGDVVLHSGASVNGVIYLPNASSSVSAIGALIEPTVEGAVIMRGEMDGGVPGITVKHWPEYVRPFVNYFVPDNPSLHVLSWD